LVRQNPDERRKKATYDDGTIIDYPQSSSRYRAHAERFQYTVRLLLLRLLRHAILVLILVFSLSWD